MTQDQVRYVGFSVAAGARHYQFEVQAKDAERIIRVFTLSVAALHFSSGKIRFQQGPDIACRKLHTCWRWKDRANRWRCFKASPIPTSRSTPRTLPLPLSIGAPLEARPKPNFVFLRARVLCRATTPGPQQLD